MRHELLVLLFTASCASVPVFHDFSGRVDCGTSVATSTGKVALNVRTHDEFGQVLPGVVIAVASQDPSRAATSIYSNGKGQADLQLEPGTYSVSADLEGFKAQKVFLYFGVSSACTIDFTLAVDTTKIETIY